MGRKNKSIDRGVQPDTLYHSVVVSKFVSRMMLHGQKATSTRIIYDAFEKIKGKTEKEPLELKPLTASVSEELDPYLQATPEGVGWLLLEDLRQV